MSDGTFFNIHNLAAVWVIARVCYKVTSTWRSWSSSVWQKMCLMHRFRLKLPKILCAVSVVDESYKLKSQINSLSMAFIFLVPYKEINNFSAITQSWGGGWKRLCWTKLNFLHWIAALISRPSGALHNLKSPCSCFASRRCLASAGSCASTSN